MPSYQAMLSRITVKKDCMTRCDYISKSMLSKANKRKEYEVEYAERDRKLEEIDQVKPKRNKAAERKAAVWLATSLTINNK